MLVFKFGHHGPAKAASNHTQELCELIVEEEREKAQGQLAAKEKDLQELSRACKLPFVRCKRPSFGGFSAFPPVFPQVRA